MLTVIPYRLLNTLTILISTPGVGVALVDSGFTLDGWVQQIFHLFYLLIILLGFLTILRRYTHLTALLAFNKVALFDLFTSAAVIILLVLHFSALLQSGLYTSADGFATIKIAVFVTFIREISDMEFNLKRTCLNPGQ